MKRTKAFMFVVVLAISSFFVVTAQKADFNGTWKLDRTKSTLAEYTPILTRIEIRINGDSLLTERYYDTGDGQEYPFKENVTLDGKEYGITIYDMPRKAKASWSDQEGSIIFESTTTANGDNGSADFISKENWKVDKITGTFTISFTNKMAGNEASGAFILNKANPN
jgi:hypothetical protein